MVDNRTVDLQEIDAWSMHDLKVLLATVQFRRLVVMFRQLGIFISIGQMDFVLPALLL